MNEMLLTTEQAAERLQLKPVTVRRLCARGELRAIKRGRDWRIPESALMEPAPGAAPRPDTTTGANQSR